MSKTLIIIRRDGAHLASQIERASAAMHLGQQLAQAFRHARDHGEPAFEPAGAVMVLGTTVYQYTATECREIASLKALTGG